MYLQVIANKAIKSTLLALIGVFIWNSAYACSFPMFNFFPPQNPLIEPKGERPEPPDVTFKVTRGHFSNTDSCADTGVITIKIPTQGYGRFSTGYLFEVVSSSEDQPIFPESAIYSNSQSATGTNEYSFPWVDGATDFQEPLEIIVNVYRIGINWVLSEPTKLVIKNHGR